MPIVSDPISEYNLQAAYASQVVGAAANGNSIKDRSLKRVKTGWSESVCEVGARVQHHDGRWYDGIGQWSDKIVRSFKGPCDMGH